MTYFKYTPLTMTDNSIPPTENMRNFVICAHIDAGKSTLSDSMLGMGRLMNFDKIGQQRGTDNRDDEAKRGITIKSTGVTIGIQYDEKDYMLNLIDTPGHSDFSMNVSASLKITDGCMVLLDAVSGIETQTITVLRQALAERVRPVLVINKFDRLICELQLEPEEAYIKLIKMISDVNNLIREYQSDDNRWLETELTPADGSVIFTSAYRNWGFDVDMFAEFYAKKNNQPKETYTQILWGDYFINSETGVISTKPTSKRVFNEMIYGPIKKLYDAISNDDVQKYTNILTNKFNESPTKNDLELSGKDLYKNIFKRIFPLAPILKRLIATKLPSPIDAQKYRADVLYGGNLSEDDVMYNGIKNCDPNGPIVFFASLMIPAGKLSEGKFYAFGRIFSGTIKPGDKLTILGENYEHGHTHDIHLNKKVSQVIKMVGAKGYSLESASAGQLIALSDVDKYVVKSGTVTSHQNIETLYPMKTVKFVVSPVVRAAVRAKNAADIPKLVEGIRKLAKSDPIIQCISSDTGEHIIAGVGELHLEISINDLREFSKTEIIVSDPIIPFKETVTTASGTICLKKSPNKHNRLYMTAEPLPDNLVKDLESGEFSLKNMPKLTKHLTENYGWSKTETQKIIGMAPYGEPSNMLVDCTSGVQYLHEIKDSLRNGLTYAVNEGIICGEQLRGIRFNLVDVTLHADAIHRGMGQLIPTMRDCVYACVLANKPTIYEPIYEVSIATTQDRIGTLYSCLSNKRGEVHEELSEDGTPTVTIKGTLPVAESMGFDSYIKEQTSGQAFPSLAFSHWSIISDRLKDKMIEDKRRLNFPDKIDIPLLEQYNDKL
jgi:elongation factor 2